MRVLLLVLTVILWSFAPMMAQAHNKVVVIVLDSPALPGKPSGGSMETQEPPPLPPLPNMQNFSHVSLANNGDYSDLAAAMAAANGSAGSPFLILLDPGEYVLTQTLVIKPFVSIRGAGSSLTTITGAVASNSINQSAALVVAADDATIGALKISNQGRSGFNYAMGVYAECSLCQLIDLEIEIGTASTSNYGLYNKAAFLESANVDITVTSTSSKKIVGVYENNAFSVHSRLGIDVTGGPGSRAVLTINQNDVTLRNATLSINAGTNRRALDIRPDDFGRVTHTKINGQVTVPPGSCFNVTQFNGVAISC